MKANLHAATPEPAVSRKAASKGTMNGLLGPQSGAQCQLQALANSSPNAHRQGALQQLADNRPLQRKATATLDNTPVQRMWGGKDEDWTPEVNNAPSGYMEPSVYHDEFGGSDHSNLDGKVWAKKISGRPALWWQNPYQETVLNLKGTRSKDIQALGGDDSGYTWHHCADYSGGSCTMQQVPTSEHSSWGHIGGASQAGYGEDG